MRDLFTEKERLERSYSIKTFWHALFGSLVIYGLFSFFLWNFGFGLSQTLAVFIASLGVSSWWFLHFKQNENRLLHARVSNSKGFVVMRDITLFVSVAFFLVFMWYWIGSLSNTFGGVISQILGLIIALFMYGAIGIYSCHIWAMFKILPKVNQFED